MSYGIGADGGNYHLFPYRDHGASDGPFREEACIGGGVLMIRSTVWQKIPKGPWFRWVDAESESLGPVEGVTLPEDVYFCELVKRHGFKIWTHQQLAGHYKTVDLTGVISTWAQLTEQAKGGAR